MASFGGGGAAGGGPPQRRGKSAQVKNKQAAGVQITAEQILREAQERMLEHVAAPPAQKISDPEELAEFRMGKRKGFEDGIRRNRALIGNWCGCVQSFGGNAFFFVSLLKKKTFRLPMQDQVRRVGGDARGAGPGALGVRARVGRRPHRRDAVVQVRGARDEEQAD
jgi:hypothetical protein